MLARQNRFRGRNALRPVFKSGQRRRAPGLSASFAPAATGRPRFAVVVSKKVDKRAVVRNRIRRRLYNQLDHYLDQAQPRDTVITVYDRQLAELPATELSSRLDQLLSPIIN